MRLISATLSVVAMFAVTPVLAEKPEKPAEAPDGEKKICKAIKVSGSRLARKRECRTEAEWEALRKDADGNRQDLPRGSLRVS